MAVENENLKHNPRKTRVFDHLLEHYDGPLLDDRR